MARPRVLTPEQESGVVELMRDGVSKADIARLYGINAGTVRNIQKRYDGESSMGEGWSIDFAKRWNEAIPKAKAFLRAKGVS